MLTVGEECATGPGCSLDGAPVGVLAATRTSGRSRCPTRAGELVIVVEDQGRVNYGPRIGEHKGLIGGVALDGEPLTGWAARPLDLDRLPGRPRSSGRRSSRPGPCSRTASSTLDQPADLFLDTLHWGKGLVWVNGFLLGRYWRRGPQRTLFVPAPVLRAGRNEVVVLEFEAFAEPEVRFVADPELGHTEI